MGMKKMPKIVTLDNGDKYWEASFENFTVKVIVPKYDKLLDIVNFGFKAPYLLVFEEDKKSIEESLAFSYRSGLANIAAKFGSSVVFVYPTSAQGWDNAPFELFPDLIKESKIHQYYKDGVVTTKDRFTGKWGDLFIRGAIFRSILFGYGKSADFIAKNYLRKIEGEYLWGPGDITPAGVVLEGLSNIPSFDRADIPTVSLNNSSKIDEAIELSCKYSLIAKERDYEKIYEDFLGRYRRWCGKIETEPYFSELSMVEEPSFEEIPTSPDNAGDDAGTKTHNIGYIAYYNKELFKKGPAPLLLAFHGGGDSSLYITHVSGWWEIAHKYNFLLVAVENHINSTATEMMELINRLKKKYNIDEKRIYATGFSMGGCKSWDCFQEYPNTFAALAPMDATFELGLNVYGKPCFKEINQDTPVPVFYAGGEITPLPELPFQAQKCFDRIEYVFKVNKVKKPYNISFDKKEEWENKIYGVNGDYTVKKYDDDRDAFLTIEYFESEDGVYRTALSSISGQGHECRKHTCENAWLFMSQFSR